MIDRMMDRRGFDNFDLRYLGLIFAILGSGVLYLFLQSRWSGFCWEPWRS